MNRNQTPVAFVASVLIHLMVLFAAARWLDKARPVPRFEPEVPPEPIARVMFPPPEAWRPPAPPSQARPAPAPRPDRPPAPEPTPPPRRDEPKDRVSIGGPSPRRQETLELRRDEDLSRRVARGRPDAPGTNASPSPGPPPPAPSEAGPMAPVASPQVAALEPAPAAEALPSAPSEEARTEGERPATPVGPPAPPPAPSIAGSLRRLDERLAGGPAGIESGAGQQMGDLFFDPQGADFTAWANSFRIEVYRNWIVPQSVRFGARGHVQIEFLVERDGRLGGLRIVRESGTPALDRAAANALLGGRFPPLPGDYRPDQLVIQVSFFYNVRAGS